MHVVIHPCSSFPVCIDSSFLFVSEWHFIVWMCHSFCILVMVLSLSSISWYGHSLCVLTANSFLSLSGISVYGCATVSVSRRWFLSLSSTSLYGHSCIHSLFLSISEWHICHSFCILVMVFVSEWHVIVWMCHRFCILAMVLSLSGTSVSGHSCVY